MNKPHFKWIALPVAIALSFHCALAANSPTNQTPPKTPAEFATQYMAAFNSKNAAALRKLRFPTTEKSEMQNMIDDINKAEMDSGTKYSKFEVLPLKPGMDKAAMGPDGVFYEPNLKPTNHLKLSAVTKNGSTSVTTTIGQHKGIYYEVAIIPAKGAQAAYAFGWQRCKLPQGKWSVLMPNEPEPGRAALEKQYGKEVDNNPDIYGVIKNTAAIKTAMRWMRCGEEGKRVNDAANKESYRASCTTYEPETLKEWFSDVKKNVDDAIKSAVASGEGKLISEKEIDMPGATAKEFEIQDKDGTMRKGRVYWIKDALYELSFESKKPKPDLASADKFLSSLQVE